MNFFVFFTCGVLLTLLYCTVPSQSATTTFSDDRPSTAADRYSNAENRFIKPDVLRPGLAILDLVESFMRMKGAALLKIQRLYQENAALINHIIGLMFDNAGKLNEFTLNGLVVFRKIFEFAANLLGKWSLPTAAIDVNKVMLKPLKGVFGTAVSGAVSGTRKLQFPAEPLPDTSGGDVEIENDFDYVEGLNYLEKLLGAQ